MTRLHLKRTPAEEQERARRKAYRAARKATKRRYSEDSDNSSPVPGPSTRSRKKHRAHVPPDTTFSDGDTYGPPPPPTSSYKPDYDTIRAELEDMQFREKMRGALEEDERLDGINAQFSDYPHVPDRWSRDKHDALNPQYMDDEEYAEWVRESMWKKTHAREYEEQMKRDAEKAARRAREKEIKAETARLQKRASEQEERQRKGRQRRREEECRQRYEQRWKALLDPQARDHGPLTFGDVPWPLFSAYTAKRKASDRDLCVEDITLEAISTFLLPDAGGTDNPAQGDNGSRRNRDKLKETLLRFHPDKFEGRFMHRVLSSDTEGVREAVGQVARALNVLMSEVKILD